MSLAHAYAEVIMTAEEEGQGAVFAEKVLTFMKHRGHLSLVPEIARIIERTPVRGGTVLTVADTASEKKFSNEIREALRTLKAEDLKQTVVVDPRAVGGFSLRAGSTIVDKTFRTALVSLYQQTIS